ncbi:flagellum-specific ATP synthase, partial [Nitratireductor pacificus pht-3B]
MLAALEHAFRGIADNDRFMVSHGGRVTEVTPTHYSVSGLSQTARLGDLVSRRGRRGAGAGEVVRISADGVLVAPFEKSGAVGMGEPVFNRGPLGLAPGPAWRGRVIDALGRP